MDNGMASRKRPRDDVVARTMREMETSNATLNAFLGPAQKRWMTSPGTPGMPVTSSVRPRQFLSQLPSSSLLSNAPASPRVVSNAIENRPPMQPHVPPRLNTNTSSSMPCHAEVQQSALTSPYTMTASNPPTPVVRQASEVSAAVLPSPAPSDDTYNNNIIDLEECEVQTSTGQSGNDIKQLSELITRYGGIERLEKQLELAKTLSERNNQPAISQTMPQNSIHTPQPSSHITGTMTPPQTVAPVLQQHQQPLLRTTSQTQVHAPPVSGMGAEIGVNPQAIRRSSLPVPQSNTPVSIPIPTPSAARTTAPQVPSQPASPSTPGVFSKYECIRYSMSIQQRLEALSTLAIPQQSKTTENGRLTLLKEACMSGDILYLALHQIYCLNELAISTSHFVSWFNLQKSGIEVIQSFLLPNTNLPRPSLSWYAKFPGDFTNLINYSDQYKRASEDVCRFMGLLGNGWPKYRIMCQKERMPPSVITIETEFGVQSPVLQRVMFKATTRAFWAEPMDKCYHLWEQVFLASQEASMQWRSRFNTPHQASRAEVAAYQQKVIVEYRKIDTLHIRHINQEIIASCQGSSAQIQNVNPLQGSPAQMQQSVSLQQARRLVSTSVPSTAPQTFMTQNPAMPQQQYVVPSQLMNTPQVSSTQEYNPPYYHQPPAQPTGMVPPRRFVPVSTSNTTSQTRPIAAPIPIHPQNLSTATTRVVPSLNNPARRVAQTTTPSVPTQGQGTSRVQVPRTISNQVLFPMVRPQTSHHSDSLLQAHLRNPENLPIDTSGQVIDPAQCFLCLSSFAINPYLIDPINGMMNGTFRVSKEDFERFPINEPDAFGAPPKRKVAPGSKVFQIRCIKSEDTAIAEHDWTIADTVWPPSLAIFINDKAVEIRRKVLHGKDFPADVTSLVLEGSNQVRLAVLQSTIPAQDRPTFSFAIEVLTVVDTDQIISRMSQIPSYVTRDKIKKQLAPLDSEIEILTSDLTIKLIDPFSAQQIAIPARGEHCVHYECFDLNTYLSTRKSMSVMEKFRCPICGADARPKSLQVDTWFVKVFEELRIRADGEARAIIVDGEGKWRVKEEEVEGESGDGGASSSRQTPSRTKSISSVPVEIIELD